VLNQPATLQARIYNLSKATAQKLLSMKPIPTGSAPTGGAAGASDPNAAKITLQAGYDGNFGIIFKGDLIQAKKGRESGTDTFVDLFAGDGDWAHAWGRINTTLAAGYTPRDVNDAIGKAVGPYGQNVADLPQDVPQKAAPRGKAMYGMSREVQSDLAKTYELNGFPRFGQFEWLTQAASKPGEIVVVNSQTGMISMPTQTNFGVSVTMLLNPSVGPGALLKINNSSIQRAQFSAQPNNTFQNNFLNNNLNADDDADGAYKVLGVDHTGDTRGNDWYTTAECIATNPTGDGAPVPPEYGIIWM